MPSLPHDRYLHDGFDTAEKQRRGPDNYKQRVGEPFRKRNRAQIGSELNLQREGRHRLGHAKQSLISQYDKNQAAQIGQNFTKKDGGHAQNRRGSHIKDHASHAGNKRPPALRLPVPSGTAHRPARGDLQHQQGLFPTTGLGGSDLIGRPNLLRRFQTGGELFVDQQYEKVMELREAQLYGSANESGEPPAREEKESRDMLLML